jgi:hypothetical protein
MTESKCPACRGERFREFPARGGLRVLRCLACGSCTLSPGNGNGSNGFTYDAGYFESWNLAPGSPAWKLRQATAAMRLETLERLGVRGGALLDVGAAGGYLVEHANRAGFDARGVEVSEHAVRIASLVVPGKVQHGALDTSTCHRLPSTSSPLRRPGHVPEPADSLSALALAQPGGWIA